MFALADDGRDRSWMDDASCRNHPNPDLWYPDTSNLWDARVREAGQICSTCPVKDQCLAFGSRERHGIYGGVLMSVRKPIPVNQAQPRNQRRPSPARSAAKTAAPAVQRTAPASPAEPVAAPAAAAAAAAPTIIVAEPVAEPAVPVETVPVEQQEQAPRDEPGTQDGIVRNVLKFLFRVLKL